MTFHLIPREPWFFEAFQRLTTELRRGAGLLVELLSEHSVRAELVDQISEVELACDAITREILSRLNATFVTPIDREDMHALATAIDNVMDAIDDASQRVPLHQIGHIRPGAAALASVIVEQTDRLVIAAQRLPAMKGVVEEAREIIRLEKEADRIHQRAVGELFDDERDAIEVIKWKDILDFIENAADRCDDAAGVLESIVIKGG